MVKKIKKVDLKSFVKTLREHPKLFGNYKKELLISEFAKLKKFPRETIILKDEELLCNEGFPSKFNLSVSEYLWSEWCKNNNAVIKKGVFDYTKVPEHSFWTIVPCSREEDFDRVLEESKQHLFLFHIALTNGCHIVKKEPKTIEEYFRTFIEFFIKQGLNPKNLVVSSFPGGIVENHGIKKKFPKDHNNKLLKTLSKKYGFKVKDTEDQTFLSLRVFGSPIFWGYRNEFLYNKDGEEWDLGTIEYLPYKPIYQTNEEGFVTYKDIVDSELAFLGGGVGLERFLLMQEGKKNILELSTIKPLADLIRKHSKNKNPNEKAILLVEEILRLIHHLVCEVGGLSEGAMGKSRRSIIAKLLSSLIASSQALSLDLNKDFLGDYLKLNKKSWKLVDSLLEDKKEVVELVFQKIEEKTTAYKNSELFRAEIDKKVIDYKLK
jgi:hypothetical protein